MREREREREREKERKTERNTERERDIYTYISLGRSSDIDK